MISNKNILIAVIIALVSLSFCVCNNRMNEVLASEITVIAEGTCGENVNWKLMSDDILTISGSGVISDYNSDTNVAPWYNNRSNIEKVVIEDGITTIGEYAFYSCDKLKEISISETVEVIKESAFKSGDLTVYYPCNTAWNEDGISGDSGAITWSEVHSYKEYEYNNDATCTEDGTKTAICSNGCGETDTVVATGTVKGHSFTRYVPYTKATCYKDGTMISDCSNGCGETKVIVATGSGGHRYKEDVSCGNATCVEDGLKIRECINGCYGRFIVKDEGSHLNSNIHILNGITIITEDTHLVNKGLKGDVYIPEGVTLSSQGGSGIKGNVYIAGTLHMGKKSSGRDKNLFNIDGNVYLIKSSSETSDSQQSGEDDYGDIIYGCMGGGKGVYKLDTFDIKKYMELRNQKSATCENEGYTGDWCCASCDKVIEKGTTINKLPHTYDEPEFVWSDDCKTCTVKYICKNNSEHVEIFEASVYSKIKKEATCDTKGITSYTATHGSYSDTKEVSDIPLLEHNKEIVTNKATINANGSIIEKCSSCGKIFSEKVIYYPEIIVLSKTSFRYNGFIQIPIVIVKDSNGKIMSSRNYKLCYSRGCVNIGNYNVKITFKGNYSGSVIKNFEIKKSNQPMILLSTIKKGTPKGTYKITITTKGNSNYNSGSKVLSIHVK